MKNSHSDPQSVQSKKPRRGSGHNFRQGKFSRERIDYEYDGVSAKLSRNQIIFLKSYSSCGTIVAACKATGHGLSTFKRWRNDPEFMEIFEMVAADFADQLEEEAIRRAVDGVRTIKLTAAGVPIKDPRKHDIATGEVKPEWKDDPWYYEESYSDRLLELLLRAKRPSEFRDRKSIEHSEQGGSPMEVDLLQRFHQGLQNVSPDLLAKYHQVMEKVIMAIEVQVGTEGNVRCQQV